MVSCNICMLFARLKLWSHGFLKSTIISSHYYGVHESYILEDLISIVFLYSSLNQEMFFMRSNQKVISMFAIIYFTFTFLSKSFFLFFSYLSVFFYSCDSKWRLKFRENCKNHPINHLKLDIPLYKPFYCKYHPSTMSNRINMFSWIMSCQWSFYQN